MAKQRMPARKPEPRTIEVRVPDGDFAGWEATVRADFPARLVIELNSGDLERILGVLDTIIVDHNMPGSNGGVAESLADVDPYMGLVAVATAIGDALASLPNR